jgi:hypothetical protein
MVMTTQFVFSLVVALSVSLILRLFMRKDSPRVGFFFLFLMLFLITLAGGLWIRPFGPHFQGVFWLPIMVIGIIAGLFLFQSAPRRSPRNRKELLQEMKVEKNRRQLEQLTYVSLDIFFWVIVVILIISIVYRILTEV